MRKFWNAFGPKMKYLIIALLTLIAALTIFLVMALSDSVLCNGDHDNIHCYARKSYTHYLISYKGSQTLKNAMSAVRGNPCNDILFTADTFSTAAALVPNNAHVTYELTELVDHLLVTNPICFLNAAKKLQPARILKLRWAFFLLEQNRLNFKSHGRADLGVYSSDPGFEMVVNQLVLPIDPTMKR